MKFDALGFGAINLDKICRVDEIVGSGQESFINDMILAPGGSAANTIVALAKLNLKTGYIGKVGCDEDGEFLINSFEKEYVNIEGIVKSHKGFSGQSLIFEDASGERQIYIYPGANDELQFEEVDCDYANNTKVLHLTSFVGIKPFKAQQKIIEKLPNIMITFDPGDIYASKGLKTLKSLIEKSSIIFTNTSKHIESMEIITNQEYKKASKFLIESGAEIVAIKLGSRGCYVTDLNESYLIEPYKVNPVSTTGAGDAFDAGFIYGHLKGKDIFYCGKFGNYIASRCITKPGARQGLPTEECISEFEKTL